ncbi:carboxymuconolactone decarboxylase family protein [Candidatus Pantoea formicae]|uniref:carboxymuconolactone decarboxylase family protein n=1 Tax=Candidatus Pantoea formicae TaxID=2608355 RepID=UPI003ED9280D
MSHSLDRESLERVAPKLAELTQKVLFADIWQRSTLTPRERSLITLATLAALGRDRQLPWHLHFAVQNGLSPEELVELFTHLAFYAGWPAAVSALTVLEQESI